MLQQRIIRSLSTTSAPYPPPGNNNRVSKSLYRQLLAWCNKYDNVPFKIPPISLTPPQVNTIALKRLKDFRTFIVNNNITASSSDSTTEDGSKNDENNKRLRTTLLGKYTHPAHFAMYDDRIIVTNDRITFSEITDAVELRAVIRSIYWLNNRRTIATTVSTEAANNLHDSEDAIKEQISLAFEGLKNCNQLSSSELDSRIIKRNESIRVRSQRISTEQDEDIPQYHVGQVVKHTGTKWRGVIMGWTIVKKDTNNNNNGRLSSLTTKDYSLIEEKTSSIRYTPPRVDETKKSKVQYTIFVDSHDVNLFQSSKLITLESEDDLLPVDDPCLQRIHNNLIKQYFTKFEDGHFVPSRYMAYVYPLDRYSDCRFSNVGSVIDKIESTQDPTKLRCSLSIINGVRSIRRRLELSLSESKTQHQEDMEEEAFSILSSLSAALMEIEVFEVESSPQTNNSEHAILLLSKLYQFKVKIDSMIWTRAQNQQHKSNIHFSLGQIVKHKLYGFRGFIVAWDPKPRMDVSNWDGLVDVENPNEKPFYHIYPDVNDCVSAFGSPRSFRYVCQDNLELSYNNNEPLDFEVDLDQDEWKWDGVDGKYIPSTNLKFLYAEDMGVHAAHVEDIIRNLRNELTKLLLGIRDGGDESLFSMDDLYYQLKNAENLEYATVVQDLIKELWKESTNCYLRNQLDTGISRLHEGKHEDALQQFSKVVESDPSYGEAWNKKATVHYTLGQTDHAIRSAEESLRIDDRNFQALAQRGLIEMEALRYDDAIDYFRKCVSLNPWMGTVCSRLSVCLSKVEKGDSWMNDQDEENPRGRMGVQWPWEQEKKSS